MKLASETGFLSELWVLLRDPASKSKVESYEGKFPSFLRYVSSSSDILEFWKKKILEVWFDLGRIWLADYRISSIIVSVSVE